MTSATGTVKNGQIVLDGPTDWPEGCRVVVEPIAARQLNGDVEHGQADDPESVRRWLAEFDAIPPWQMTAGEEVEWQKARQAIKDHTLERMKDRFAEE